MADLKTLHSDMSQRLVAVIHFIRAGLETHANDGILSVAYEPSSYYHEDFVENRVLLDIRFRTDYPSEKAKAAMKPFLDVLDHVTYNEEYSVLPIRAYVEKLLARIKDASSISGDKVYLSYSEIVEALEAILKD